MIIPTKKLKNGFNLPVFGLGTWQMGGREERNPDNDDERDIAAIRAAIDRGLTHIDTAEIYANGRAEEIIAQAIAPYERPKLFIVSKVSGEHQRGPEVMAACEASLKRLRTPYLDLYLLHRHDPTVPLSETIGAMNKLVERGLVRQIGLSNFDVASHQEARRFAATPIVASQAHYNLKFREPERAGLLDYCQQNDTLLIAWRPLGKGLLAQAGLPLVDELCEKYNKTPAQIAINWLICQPNVVTLAKSSSLAHLEENLGALGWEMEPADIERLRREYPGQESVSDVVALG